MRIGLIGFQNAGKTSVGKEIALRLSLPHIDLDELVCKKLGVKTPRDAVLENFREVEREMSLEYPQVVLSFGGGAMHSIQKAHNMGYSLVYLYRPMHECVYTDQPLWLNKNFADIWNERHPIFSSCAYHTVEAYKEGLVEEIVALYGK